MSGNTFGKIFCLTSFGESHGKALGCVIDGCPPGLKIDESDIQKDLDRRKPGKSKYTSQNYLKIHEAYKQHHHILHQFLR